MTKHHFTATCAYFTAAHYMRAVEHLADQIYAPTGMKPAYAYIMMALEDQDGVSISDLARTLGYERTSLSRMVRQLEKNNLVTLTTAGRKNLVFLTKDSGDFLKIANACLEQFAHITDRLLGVTKPAMTKLLTQNTKKLEERQ